MLNEIKLSMRITHSALDIDIQSNIDICLMDLNIAGVYFDEPDGLIKKACELYCKWQYDYLGKAELFERAFFSLKNALALCGDYNVRPSD